MRTTTLLKEVLGLALLARLIFAPGVVAFAQTAAAAPNPLMDLL